ncbi:MAG: undecaprenyl-phosphate glucose phosphotransferase [Cyclobacteriaceae bacterium]|nr:undecaprenyl-phosphate glucose phosphotransferase [Cyclobacteriaceae bacterium]
MKENQVTKRFYILFPIAFIFSNTIAVGISYFLALFIEFNSFSLSLLYQYGLILSLLVWIAIEAIIKDFKIGRSSEYIQTLNQSLRTTSVFISAILFIWFFSEFNSLQRGFLGTFFISLFILIAINRLLIHSALNRYRRVGRNFRNAVIVGYDNLGTSLYEALGKTKDHGIRCFGFYGENQSSIGNSLHLGSISDFLQAKWNELDFIYVSGHLKKPIIDQIIERADNEFVKVKLLPTFAAYQPKIYTLKRFNNISIIDVNDLPLDNVLNRVLKRSFDIIFSLAVIFLLISWLYPLIALIILLESKGPIIFRQRRHGKNNQIFECYKFRTMVVNSEADIKWAVKNDPRVTKFGMILRRTSLDELPQFFNVLRGDMAIVGPRPHAIEMNEHYKGKVEKFYQRHTHKPGITGLAQAMGYRGEIRELHHIKSRVKLDRFYLQNWSFGFDLKIIIRTIYVLIRGQESAY